MSHGLTYSDRMSHPHRPCASQLWLYGRENQDGLGSMAIFYSRMSLVSRSQGQSAIAAAAYRAGVRLQDVRTDLTHNYSKKRGVLQTCMLAPSCAPWALDIGEAWNRAESVEVRRNARTARELVVALPAELAMDDQFKLARLLGQDLVDRYGVAVLVAVHAPDAKGDERNTHVHLLMSTRVAEQDGYGKKVRILDDKVSGPKEAEAMRRLVAERINAALDERGHIERVDSRPWRIQAAEAADCGDLDGVVKAARTPMKHQGRAATALSRRGESSIIVSSNAAILIDNARVRNHGLQRAAHLKTVIKARTAKMSRAVAATRLPAPRPLPSAPQARVGPVGSGERATGRDAQMLNEAAALSVSTARLVRDAAEAYLRMLAREVEHHAEAVRVYLLAVGTSPREVRRVVPRLAGGRVDTALLERATSSHADWRRAEEEHLRQRRRASQAELRTAQANKRVVRVDAARPPRWKLLTRREWAEHRRSVRAALKAAQENERFQRSGVDDQPVRSTEQAWRRAHGALMSAIEALPRPAKPRGRRQLTGARPSTPVGDELVLDVDALMGRPSDAALPLAPAMRPRQRPRTGRRPSGP